MTLPFDNIEDEATLRKRWWSRYWNVQKKYDTQIRTLLVDAAQDAQDRIITLGNNPTFSAGVRTTQLRLAVQELKKTHRDLFGQFPKIIIAGQKDEAGAAFDALSATDLQYLRDAVAGIYDEKSYLKSARQGALNNVTATIQRITKSQYPLSTRVYRSELLANRWVQNVINRSLAHGDSAKDLAKKVRSSIIPATHGGTSYASLRLGRTELNNAFHATAITSAQDRPWVTGMRWYVSDTHEDDPTEICTRLKDQIFPVNAVPTKPHPQCRCWIAAELESLFVFKQNLTAGVYRDWIANAA